jgi:hypothetical protein
MKKFIIHYILAMLVCFALGLIVALISFFSWVFALLLIFPISLGWIPFTLMIEWISPKQAEDYGCLVIIVFILLIVLVILGAVFVHDNTFWGQACAVSLFAAIISHIILMLKIRNKMLNNGI